MSRMCPPETRRGAFRPPRLCAVAVTLAAAPARPRPAPAPGRPRAARGAPPAASPRRVVRGRSLYTNMCMYTALGACMKGLGYYWVSPRTKKPPKVTVHVKSLKEDLLGIFHLFPLPRAGLNPQTNAACGQDYCSAKLCATRLNTPWRCHSRRLPHATAFWADRVPC